MKNVMSLMKVFILTLVVSFTAMATQVKQADPQMGGIAMPMMSSDGSMRQMLQDCPMNIPDAENSVADTSDGIALTLTTKSGNVEELRRRAERMATVHTVPAENAFSMPTMQGTMMPGNVKYEAISQGARITLTPKDPVQLSEFRRQVRNRLEHMGKTESICVSMQGMMQGMTDGMGKPSTEAKPEPKEDESGVDHSQHHPAEKP